jgi:hypothetical protein
MRKNWIWIVFGVGLLFAFAGGSGSSYPPYIVQFANAIAFAEGFSVVGSQPNRKNNPGDLESGGVVQTYSTVQDGWNALYNQVTLMFNGQSAHYSPDMTIEQVGYIYSPDGADNWINNVSSYLGVSRSTTLSSLT